MMKKFLLLAIFLMFVLFIPLSSASALTFNATADSWVEGDYDSGKNNNYGKSGELEMSGAANDAFIRWDDAKIFSEGNGWARIDDLKFEFYLYRSSDTSFRKSIHAITAPWDEMTITYNNKPSYSNVNLDSAPWPSTNGYIRSWYIWDINAVSTSQQNLLNICKNGLVMDLYIGTDGRLEDALIYGKDTNGSYYPSKLHVTFSIAKSPTLSSTSSTQNSITLNINRGDFPAGVNIKAYRNGSYLKTITSGGSTFTDSGLTPGVSYNYQFSAEYSGVEGPLSSTYSVRTIPPTPNTPTGTLSRISWSQTAGRSNVILSWPACAGATGYKVGVFDGNAYRAIDVRNVTSWNLANAKIYPDESWLNGQANNSISNDPFNHSTGGFALRDDPNNLYLKTVGTTYDSAHNYWFRVSAYNEAGESPYSTNTYTPTLPDATDTGAPSGMNNTVSSEGLEKTYNTNVKVTVTASDSESGIYQIALSNDNVSFTVKHTAAKGADGGTGVTSYNDTFDWTVTPGAGTKTVYVKIIDAVGNSVVVTDSIALAEDMLPPSITLLINGGATSTTSKNVTLTIVATDNTSVSSQMQMSFSNDGNLWSPWETFTQTKAWDLTNTSYGGVAGAAVKKVYARLADLAQNSSIASASIGYNPTPPTGTVTVTGGTSGTFNGNSVIFVSGDTPTLTINAAGASMMRYDTGLGAWSDWETYASSKQIVLAKSNGVCKVRIQVQDAYGVTSNPTEILVVVDGLPPTINSVKTLSGASATSGNSIILVVSATDNISKNFQYDINGGTKQALPANGIITAPVSGSGPVPITVNVYDDAGNKGSGTISIWKLN
ncbi:tRNA3(Ser)-specific nuclease WapA precursor [Pelotomaculum schinkii]|uniref:tRNA3(Ser)-specific nuclease WapA n=1 Tax=Pelotomaculum schinkii TaxID=78350 RepID=A0A4Y7R7K3_9FIRM|nr:DNRLRE domain-containing protein [Pelotomaculum schinkii]TEB04732.1 tRNA3(Ser)-specific nuclease WapA precursor [Pelotomaculum schinkii]